MEPCLRALVLGCLLVTIPTAAAGRGQATSAPVNFEVLRRQAEEARVAGRVDEAVGLYKRAVAQQPSWTEGYWYLGTIYYDTDRHGSVGMRLPA